MRKFLLSTLLLSTLALGLVAPLQAQSRHTPLSAADVIDGSKAPERIPDHVAYRMVLISMTLPAEPTVVDFNHQSALLSIIGISGATKRAEVVALLQDFRASYDDFQRQGQERPIRKGLKDLKKGLTLDTVQKLSAIFSAEEMKSFHDFVQEAKSHIVTTEAE